MTAIHEAPKAGISVGVDHSMNGHVGNGVLKDATALVRYIHKGDSQAPTPGSLKKAERDRYLRKLLARDPGEDSQPVKKQFTVFEPIGPEDFHSLRREQARETAKHSATLTKRGGKTIIRPANDFGEKRIDRALKFNKTRTSHGRVDALVRDAHLSSVRGHVDVVKKPVRKKIARIAERNPQMDWRDIDSTSAIPRPPKDLGRLEIPASMQGLDKTGTISMLERLSKLIPESEIILREGQGFGNPPAVILQGPEEITDEGIGKGKAGVSQNTETAERTSIVVAEVPHFGNKVALFREYKTVIRNPGDDYYVIFESSRAEGMKIVSKPVRFNASFREALRNIVVDAGFVPGGKRNRKKFDNIFGSR